MHQNPEASKIVVGPGGKKLMPFQFSRKEFHHALHCKLRQKGDIGRTWRQLDNA